MSWKLYTEFYNLNTVWSSKTSFLFYFSPGSTQRSAEVLISGLSRNLLKFTWLSAAARSANVLVGWRASKPVLCTWLSAVSSLLMTAYYWLRSWSADGHENRFMFTWLSAVSSLMIAAEGLLRSWSADCRRMSWRTESERVSSHRRRLQVSPTGSSW